MLHVITGQISHLTDECTPYFSLLSFTLSCEFPSQFFLPLSPLPSSMFLSFTLTASLSPWILLSFSLHFSQQLSPLCTILQSHSNTLCIWRIQKTISCILTSELQHQFDTLQNVSMFFSAGPKICKNTFSITDLERILAWWDPHEPDLSKLTLYTEFTALINQHFNLWLYVFSLAS